MVSTIGSIAHRVVGLFHSWGLVLGPSATSSAAAALSTTSTRPVTPLNRVHGVRSPRCCHFSPRRLGRSLVHRPCTPSVGAHLI
jgi:hypothetical protein